LDSIFYIFQAFGEIIFAQFTGLFFFVGPAFGCSGLPVYFSLLIALFPLYSLQKMDTN
jgi:hypothetical protein